LALKFTLSSASQKKRNEGRIWVTLSRVWKQSVRHSGQCAVYFRSKHTNRRKECVFQRHKLKFSSACILVALRRIVFLASSKIPLPLLMLNRAFLEECSRMQKEVYKYIVLINFVNIDTVYQVLLPGNMYVGTFTLAFSFKVETCKAQHNTTFDSR
jgi:hypothetical protein